MPQRKNNRLFLTKIQIKGFKSITDLKIDVEPGLNILIGKNGSGKSNFLEALFLSLSSKLRRTSQSKYSKLELTTTDNDVFLWEAEGKIEEDIDIDIHKNRRVLREKINFNGDKFYDNLDRTPKFIDYKKTKVFNSRTALQIFHRMGYDVSPLYIKFNLPENLICFDTPGVFRINDSGDINGLQGDFEISDTLDFVFNLFFRIELELDEHVDSNLLTSRSTFLKRLKIDQEIKDNLRLYTPIKDISFNDNINIYEIGNATIIENLKIDFKINNSWMPWSQLSDGTKRLFYLVSEIAYKKSGMILVEEPELGVHPAQFNMIMQFLKEEAITKQVFISTHSPQALNHLDENELANILVTSLDPKKGTQIKHLSTAQKNKAKKYMKDVGFLSDYWMLSDLE